MPFYRVAQKCGKWISNSNHLRSRLSIRLAPFGPRMCPACGRVWQYLASGAFILPHDCDAEFDQLLSPRLDVILHVYPFLELSLFSRRSKLFGLCANYPKQIVKTVMTIEDLLPYVCRGFPEDWWE